MQELIPRPLNAQDFAPFGDVIEVSPAAETRVINETHTTRYHRLATLDLQANGGDATINIFRSQPVSGPVIIRLMERHPLSSQAFYPLGDKPYLVIVAPPGDFSPEAICAFIASPNQGVNYRPGTWHHYSLALGSVSDFLVVDRDAPDENCDEIHLPENQWCEIQLDAEIG